MDAPITESFIRDNPEVDEAMATQIRHTRALMKASPVLAWAVDNGWDATQRYAEDTGMTYEQARSALMSNRGFFDLVSYFFLEALGFAGPINALRVVKGSAGARALDQWILDTYGDDVSRRLYHSVGTRPQALGGYGQAVTRKRYDIIPVSYTHLTLPTKA